MSKTRDTHEPLPAAVASGAEHTEPVSPGGSSTGIDLSHLRLSQNFQAALGVTKRLTTVPVRRAGPQDFFRVHPSPEYALETMLLEFKDDNEVYLVDPSLWHDLAGELVPKVLYVTVSRQGVVRLWPIRLPDEEGKLDDWNRSALEAAEIGKTSWMRVKSNRSLGAYEVFDWIDRKLNCEADPANPDELICKDHSSGSSYRRSSSHWRSSSSHDSSSSSAHGVSYGGFGHYGFHSGGG
jgi:hypothetical protein